MGTARYRSALNLVVTSADIQHEKVETELRERIGSFHKEDLQHAETTVKNVLPSSDGDSRNFILPLY
ncbi:hypothetical protein RRG08_017075 [Elysia crispata]|uniref:Uncharacterized protein n=1 Tax=Elysia crispata TaxID=231223 RepID=A0AAE0ZUZ8_9GAST|nr:hypothetical protein RRG08_017075 [Elysia crispata]